MYCHGIQRRSSSCLAGSNFLLSHIGGVLARPKRFSTLGLPKEDCFMAKSWAKIGSVADLKIGFMYLQELLRSAKYQNIFSRILPFSVGSLMWVYRRGLTGTLYQ